MTKLRNPATAARTEQAAASVRALWEAGTRSLARVQARPKTGKLAYSYANKLEIQKEEGRREKLNYDTVTKAWRIAAEYTSAQVDRLCRDITRHRSSFGSTHLLRLLGVSPRERRNQLMNEAIRNRWSVVKLQQAIMAEKGRRPLVGRRPAVPEELPELLTALVSLADKWVRWCGEAETRLPKTLKTLVGRSTIAVRAVKDAAAGKLPQPAARGPTSQ